MTFGPPDAISSRHLPCYEVVPKIMAPISRANADISCLWLVLDIPSNTLPHSPIPVGLFEFILPESSSG